MLEFFCVRAPLPHEPANWHSTPPRRLEEPCRLYMIHARGRRGYACRDGGHGGVLEAVWHLLEDTFELILANASHIKSVPGRKTDINDATWIAGPLAHGLIRASFVPPTAIQELLELTRSRKQLNKQRIGLRK